MKHKVRIIVTRKNEDKQEIICTGHRHLPKWLARLMFGHSCEVLVLVPGKTVSGIEISELKDGDTNV